MEKIIIDDVFKICSGYGSSGVGVDGNILESKVVKIFSVASVAMLPPTLIASVYGMNFAHMPELGWRWGYPFSLGLMALSVALPFWYFRRKGWLK